MANRYTDVDLMILKRWDDVKALREAFDDLLGRMEDVVEGSLHKVATVVSERGLSSEFEMKRPSIWFWKRDWETRSKKGPGIYFQLFDFVPTDYSKAVEDYPSMWLMTDEFSKLKMRESSEDFGRAVRAALSPELLRSGVTRTRTYPIIPWGGTAANCANRTEFAWLQSLTRWASSSSSDWTSLWSSFQRSIWRC